MSLMASLVSRHRACLAKDGLIASVSGHKPVLPGSVKSGGNGLYVVGRLRSN